jgi:hypothetical protein
MVRLVVALFACLLLAAPAAGSSPDQGKGKKAKRDGAVVVAAPGPAVAVHVVFAGGDVEILRGHYATRYRNLPPGLRKKVARGGQLPPGWQKKFEVFPVVVEGRLHPLPAGYRRGVIDGHAVIYDSRTHVVVDVAVLF